MLLYTNTYFCMDICMNKYMHAQTGEDKCLDILTEIDL